MLVSINKLAELTGKSRNTIRKRLAPLLSESDSQTVAHALDSARALALIFGEGAEGLDPAQERALLDRTRRELAELDLDTRRGHLIAAETVSQKWDSIAANIRAKLLNLPGRLTTTAYGTSTPGEHEQIAKRLIHECLSELAAQGGKQ